VVRVHGRPINRVMARKSPSDVRTLTRKPDPQGMENCNDDPGGASYNTTAAPSLQKPAHALARSSGERMKSRV